MERNDLMTVHARNVRRQIERNDRGGDFSSGIPANTLRFCVSSRARPSRLDVFIGLSNDIQSLQKVIITI